MMLRFIPWFTPWGRYGTPYEQDNKLISNRNTDEVLSIEVSKMEDCSTQVMQIKRGANKMPSI